MLSSEAVALKGRQDRIPAAWNTAERGAFDDLRQMHGGLHRASEQRRHRGKDRGVAGPAGDHDIGPQRAAERLRAHLADMMRSLVYVGLVQRRHVVQGTEGSNRSPSASQSVFPTNFATAAEGSPRRWPFPRVCPGVPAGSSAGLLRVSTQTQRRCSQRLMRNRLRFCLSQPRRQ